MSIDLHYGATAATGYNQSFGRVSAIMVPKLLQMAHIAEGQNVLDIGTGTGIAAEAVANIVGAAGHVTAADKSAPMLAQARQRLDAIPNVTFAIEDGQALSLPGESFDAVLCNMALMLFPEPARGLSEFHRVLKAGGRIALSVNTVPERSFVTRIAVAIARHVPSRAAEAARYFSLGDPIYLRRLIEAAGFTSINLSTETYDFSFPSFDAYFQPIEDGLGGTATEYMGLTPDLRRIVRDEVRGELEGTGVPGAPITVPVELLFASGQK